MGKTWDERIEAAREAFARAYMTAINEAYGEEGDGGWEGLFAGPAYQFDVAVEAFCDGDTLYRKVTDPDEIAHYEYEGGYFWDQDADMVAVPLRKETDE